MSSPLVLPPEDYTPSHANTAFCKQWPKFALVDLNNLGSHKEDGQKRHTYGLASLPKANATIVMQLFADQQISLDIAEAVHRMKIDLLEEFDLHINTVWLNNCMPFKCTQRKCTSGNCADWFGGCHPNAAELKLENWQYTASHSFPEMAIFQDTKDKQVWRKFGGGKNDLLIYDSDGLLYSYGCSSNTCLTGVPGYNANVLDLLGYQNVKSLVHLAANTNGAVRCQLGSQCSITRGLAPESWLDHEYVDIFVVAILIFFGITLGVVLPKMWSKVQDAFCSTTEIARDRFIQLSTIDNDILDDEPEYF